MPDEYKILPRSRLFELYNLLNKENISNCKAVAIRDIDVTQIDRRRHQMAKEGRKASYTSFVAKAAAKVLQEMPQANRAAIETFCYTRVFSFQSTHISVAVERNDADNNYGGAFVYTIYDTDKKELNEISKEIADLSTLPNDSVDPRLERWQRILWGTKWTPFLWIISLVLWTHKNIPFLYIKNRGGALMISSPSKYGVDFIVAHWPYTIGLSFGLVKQRPWIENGEVVVRKTMSLTLAFDRRIIPGAQAARFMNRLCEILENAEAHFP